MYISIAAPIVNDCFELGRLAYSNQDYYHTILWMEQALSVMAEFSPLELTVMDYLAFSYYSVRHESLATKERIRMYRHYSRISPGFYVTISHTK